jgi:hypothetical protein
MLIVPLYIHYIMNIEEVVRQDTTVVEILFIALTTQYTRFDGPTSPKFMHKKHNGDDKPEDYYIMFNLQ